MLAVICISLYVAKCYSKFCSLCSSIAIEIKFIEPECRRNFLVVISIVFGNYLGKSVVMDIQAISGCRYSGCMRGNKVGPST